MDLERSDIGIGNKPALIVVDMIYGFTDPACDLGIECESALDANRQLLHAFRSAKLPVYFTTVIYRDTKQAKVFRQHLPALNVLTPDSHWVQIESSLAPSANEEIIEKCWASAFFSTDLADKLKLAQVDSLIVTGMTTSGCVRATVVDGLQHDYPVLVPREAVADRNQQAHTANLHDMHAKYADVVSLDETLAVLKEK